MKKIILDTETTGLNKNTNRIIEIGCIKTFDNIPTGEIFHVYLNPEMKISEECFAICGLTNEFLSDKPFFKNIVKDLFDFIGDDPIVAHNANFDISFLNMEREKLQLSPIKNLIIDTLKIARKVFPGLPCSLDALCKRFKISLHKREKHGALIDAELLSKVYFYLIEKQNDDINLICGDLEKEEKEEYIFSRPLLIIKDEEDLILHSNLIKKYSL